MTYQEFKNKYNEKYIDYDGAYGTQCWDLIQYYNVEVLNVPDSVFSGCGWVGNMVLWEWKYNQLMEYFDEVPVTQMDQGDVCIWSNPNNEQQCHVAVFDSWDGYSCWYFSQNPNPCRVMQVNGLGNPRAFRRKKEVPTPEPSPVITPNVEKDEHKNQIEVLVDDLRIRTSPGLDGEAIGHANPGYYNYLETEEKDGYVWYRISNTNWIASNDEWTKVYPKKEEFVKFKVLDEKDGYFLVDLGEVLIKEKTL